jgi:hypothetical protein
MLTKHRINFLLIITALAVVIASGCKKSTYYQLTDEEMKWLVYKNNEIIRMENSNGEKLFYYVTIRLKGYSRDGDTYRESTAAIISQLNDTSAIFIDDSMGELGLSKSENGFLATLTWPHFPIKHVPLSSMVPTVMNVGGINYNDTFVLDGTGFTDLRFYNKKIWVSKSFGILQVEEADGTLWVRQFN